MLNKSRILRRLDALIVPLIIVLVALIAFGLGRLSALQQQKPTLQIHSSGQSQVQ